MLTKYENPRVLRERSYKMATIPERLNVVANDMKAVHLLLDMMPGTVQGKPYTVAED